MKDAYPAILLSAFVVASALGFSACDNANSSNSQPAAIKSANEPLGTIGDSCQTEGAGCSTNFQCCGLGVCDSSTGTPLCNSNSCLLAGQRCLSNIECCSGACFGACQ